MDLQAQTTPNYQATTKSTTKVGHTIEELNGFYTEGDGADRATFAEMRSNLLLVAGEHYQKKDSNFFRQIRDAKELSSEQKLRLTKNHVQKITNDYVNIILAAAPGVGFSPKNEKELHDQKVTDMHHAIWRDAVERYALDEKIDDWCDSFVQVGEVAVKIFWDPSIGVVRGYAPKADPMGQPIMDPMGQMQPDEEKPIYSGGFVFEEIYGFNLLRPVECKDLRDAEWLGLRKMVNTDALKRRFPGEDNEKMIQESQDDTFLVFDPSQGGYSAKGKNQVSVREYYFKPCQKYPEGYFYITTKEGILAEGALPGGVFPIIVQTFARIKTTPRGRSPIKHMRPYQAEINRSASKIAEHQITLGDDKLLVQNGTKVSAAKSLPGIRTVSFTGSMPTVLEGRSGAQYLEYMQSQITELYQVMNANEVDVDSKENLDPYVLLYRAASKKKRFQRSIARFERFLIELVKVYLRLCKVHLEDDAIVQAIGSTERVNIPEFKQSPDICFEVKIEAQSDDIETKLGKQIVLNHALQYVGSQLKPDQIGKIMRAMPFSNAEESFSDFTLEQDNATNDILAMERGETPPVQETDDHVYMAKRLVSRMKQADFKFLSPQIQNNFKQKYLLHQQMNAFQIQQAQRAEQGFIPTDGYLVPIDFYVSDPSDKTGTKTRRARLPYSSLAWLIKQLETQGQTQDQFEAMSQGAQADIGSMMPNPSGGMRGPAGGPRPAGPPIENPLEPLPARDGASMPMGQGVAHVTGSQGRHASF
jgi:hypothetical protein